MSVRIRGRLPVTEETVEVVIEGERIARVEPVGEREGLPWLAPGFIDHQVNGFGGYDVNDPDPSPEAIMSLVRALWPTGVTRFCPTIITNDEESITRSLRAIAEACDQDPITAAAIAAVHVEGPFISPEDGPRGAHRADCVRPPDWDEFCRWQEAAEGRIGIVTLSPEWPQAIAFIERLTEAGVIAAIGHTAASPAQIRDAACAGARLSTHLGNGSHLMLPRHDNYLWEQLACDELWAGVILDGHHLPPAVVKTILRAKGLERVVLTTDAVAMAGLPPGRYQLNQVDVELTPQGRIEVVGGGGVLGGSALEMPVGIANAMRFAGLTLAQALSLATTQPARLLSLPDVTIAPGRRADLAVLHYDPETKDVRVLETWVRGSRVFAS